MSNEKLMLKIRDASAKTGLTYNCIRQLCLANKIKYIRSGNTIYVNMVSLFDYCGGYPSNGAYKVNSLDPVLINK